MDILSKFHELVYRKNIGSEVFSMFEALPDTPKRVKFFKFLLDDNNLIPNVEVCHPKNDDVSKKYREAANNLYRKKKYVDALEGYNKAICFASTEGLSLGYANRAAVYLELKLYDECLDNVRLAREAGYPTRLLSKLTDRETKCREAIRKRSANKKPSYQPKLSYPASRENPSVTNCIELVVSEKYGRHFVAKQNLKVGDIVILEKPYQAYLYNAYISRRCTNCLAENRLNLIPCPGCTKTMFCSQKCLQSAKKFHNAMCPIVDRIFEIPDNPIFLALRILLSLIHDSGSIEALAAFKKLSSAQNRLPRFDIDEEVRQRHNSDAFHTMKPDLEVLKFNDAILFAVIYSWLANNTDFASQLVMEESQDLFLEFLHRYSYTCKMYSYPLDILERKSDGGKLENPISLQINSIKLQQEVSRGLDI
jgi:tetratricopeptide (TPR) repeat protein